MFSYLILRKDSFTTIVTASYSWDTLSKLIFWQLVHAENVPVEWMMPLLPKIQLNEHAEAVTNVYIMLQRYISPHCNLFTVCSGVMEQLTEDFFKGWIGNRQ